MGEASNTMDFVNHPRYGNKPVVSEYNFSSSEINSAHWRYQSVKYFPDTDKQYYAVYPRTKYVDIEELCEVCKRPFIFYALEQKHWFEELGFYIDAHCTRCIDCRKKDQEIKQMKNSYYNLVLNKDRSPEETKTLKNVALELFQLGIIKDKTKIDRIS
ncbi:zinc-ribbon domain-containing protein [Shewanella violacea]|uniref:Probable zinc-binding domain-containing protein n=1 Tax=Shewanella violacea (strain JCM 10179 / CIP 106290 / LMG 19151 / DSS12) TaxID=637905 RepID=D4ZIY0_SHEVD|nr:zinc-ribbon domain-containing protein [Shewanella violacea]BAJ01629.1 hypothetical protein SVI_1658 [Shewanella violacea DSS12]